MIWIALRMLTGDRQKFYGLVFGVAFSTLLITQQLTIFANLLERGASGVYNVPDADVWVMDPATRTIEVAYPLPSTALDRVRSVPGILWAVPHLRATASVRTSTGNLEAVAIVGVDDSTLVGLPRRVAPAKVAALTSPGSVIIDDVGAGRMFGVGNPVIGQRFELNDQRAVIRGVTDSFPNFTNQVTLYTRYSEALSYVPGTRNRLTFILVKGDGAMTDQELAHRIAKITGLRARSSEQFADDAIEYILENTGIPMNFGITVGLGFIIGVAIIGLTFSLFIRDSIKQFGALKAIGVSNKAIRRMVTAQASMIGLIGYSLGLVGTALFVWGFSNSATFKGFYIPWQVPLISFSAVALILAATSRIALNRLMTTEPAAVFR